MNPAADLQLLSNWKTAAASIVAGLQMITLTTPVLLSKPMHAWGNDQPAALALVQTASPNSAADTVTDQAWELLNKYFIDKSFHGQDWAAMRTKANLQAKRDGSFTAVSAMAKSLGDKYTRALDSSAFGGMFKFDLIGVGVLFSVTDNGQVYVASPPMQGSTGFAAGLKQGDVITAINGRSTQGMSSFDVIEEVMEGNLPTITLAIDSGSEAAPARVVSLDRTVTNVRDPVEYKVLDGSHTGYIQLTEFNSRTLVYGLRRRCPARRRHGAIFHHHLSTRRRTV
jgi:C-terminal processing protease CtpA/Prc